MKTIIIISQNGLIRYISKYLRYILLKIFKSILAIFSSLFFDAIPKMLNVIKLTMIFRVIYHPMMFAIG